VDERQAFLAIRNAIRLENLGRNVAGKVAPQLREAFKVLRLEISEWPEGQIERELVYKQLYARMPALFGGVNNSLYQELTSALRDEAGEQLTWAAKMLGEGGSIGQNAEGFRATLGASPAQQVAIGFGQTAPTPTQLSALVDDVQVLGQTLERLFRPEREGSVWIKSQIKMIDRVVKEGFLSGATNDQIARNMVSAANRSLSGSRAVARTAVMDMSQRAHNRFWDANSDVIELWEFDATFDYRVCPQCYPHDGERRKDRNDLPQVPVHPNCRCRILPLTETALRLEKEEAKEGMVMSTVQVGKPKQGGSKERVYKTKVKIDGKKATRFAKEYEVPRGQRPTMAFFLRRANNETREQVLGKGNAKRFEAMLKNGRDEQDALRDIIANPARRRK
jgi:SPP1 gp7 family putative phage head morphogenesis protein